MQITTSYSHLNGEECLVVHRPQLLEEVRAVIKMANTKDCQTKLSKEKDREGRRLYPPI